MPSARSGDRPRARLAHAFPFPVRVHRDPRTSGDLLADPEGGQSRKPRRTRPPCPSAPCRLHDSRSTPGSATPTGSPARDIATERVALAAGDYGVANGPETIAVVERKTLENLVASLSDGTMAFQMQRLGEVGRAAVVVEGRYSAAVQARARSRRLHRRRARPAAGPVPRGPGRLRRLAEVRRGVDLPVPRSRSFGRREVMIPVAGDHFRLLRGCHRNSTAAEPYADSWGNERPDGGRRRTCV